MCIFVEVVNREITIEKFENTEDAKERLKKRFAAWDGPEQIGVSSEMKPNEMEAWVNSDFNGGTNIDLKIEEFED